jgi:hypothetical protein
LLGIHVVAIAAVKGPDIPFEVLKGSGCVEKKGIRSQLPTNLFVHLTFREEDASLGLYSYVGRSSRFLH